jgi:Asp-tRNA(Asn)/Glu-tRNA(Gln) amidotransferase C subunit
MPELTPAQVLALAEAVRLPVSPDDLAEVTHRLNAFLEALAHLADLPLERVEPLPMLPDANGPEAGAPPERTP